MNTPAVRLRHARRAGVPAAAVTLLLAGCTVPATSSGSGGDAAAPALTGTLTVYAAASLDDAFTELAEEFEAANAAVDVRPIVLDGSSRLATQLAAGAAADVFASADEPTMETVTRAGLAADPETFATNTLVIAVPTGNPAGIGALDDLARDEVTTVLCAPEVPCGAASQSLLSKADVEVTPASLEQNVTAVLTKVEADEADAGLVYATDVVGRDTVDAVIPVASADVVNRYSIVRLAAAGNPVAADVFVDFVAGPEGHAVLAAHGFGTP